MILRLHKRRLVSWLLLLSLGMTGLSLRSAVAQTPDQTGSPTTADEEAPEPPNRCEQSIKLSIGLAFEASIATEDRTAALDRWQSGIETVWQNAERNYRFHDSPCGLGLDITLIELPETENCNLARYNTHCLTVTADILNRRGLTADITENAIGQNLGASGEWSLSTSAGEAAHLIGRLLGLTPAIAADNPTIMDANPLPTSGLTQAQIDGIADRTDATCSLGCYCGNQRLDAKLGESCDPTAGGFSCALGETCSESCACQPIGNVCGDGLLGGQEACDYAADEPGCPANNRCTESCTCQPLETPVKQAPPERSFVCGNGICEPAESCTVCFLDCQTQLACQICGNGICESSEDIFSCAKDCGSE